MLGSETVKAHERYLLLPRWRRTASGAVTIPDSQSPDTSVGQIKFGPVLFCDGGESGERLSKTLLDAYDRDQHDGETDLSRRGPKLFSFCREKFPQLSKRQLHACFVQCEVVLNGTRVGRGSETTCLCVGDTVSIQSAGGDYETSDCLVRAGVAILYRSPQICVIYKPPGIGCADGSDLSIAVTECIWPSGERLEDHGLSEDIGSVDNRSGGRLLYTIGKNQSGLLFAASSPSVLEAACTAVTHGRLQLEIRCVVCGKLVENGAAVVALEGSGPQFRIAAREIPEVELLVTLVHSSPCRSVSELSVVDVVPIFRPTATASGAATGNSCFRSPPSIRNIMKHIKFIMSQAGHTIVGDFDMVKKDKGVYLSLCKIRNLDPVLAPFADAQCEYPSKFKKLIEREKAFHEKAIISGLQMLQGNADMSAPLSDASAVKSSLEEGYPPEYIAQCAQFLGRSYFVNDSVMIPRKSSEALIAAVLKHVAANIEKHSSFSVLDIGTGSGCLLLSCVAELRRMYPDADVRGVGIDICTKALDVAIENRRRMGLTDTVFFIEQNFADFSVFSDQLVAQCPTLIPHSRGLFNIVLCNPPYSAPYRDSRISRARILYEPDLALFGVPSTAASGEKQAPGTSAEDIKKRKLDCGDEFTSYRTISNSIRNCRRKESLNASSASPLLFEHGAALFFEVGNGQSNRVADIIAGGDSGCLKFFAVHRDFKELPRCLEFVYI